MGYIRRLADQELLKNLAFSGAVLIQGIKGSGKTETALQIAKSHTRFDIDKNVPLQMEVDPFELLEGTTPRLIDEWQEYPEIWNYIRHAVDDRKQKGQFILTGSANPEERAKLHSGAGRFAVMKMRPLSLFESGLSTGEVSLKALMEGTSQKSKIVDFHIKTLAETISIGGLPNLVGESCAEALHFMRNYIKLIAEVDVSRVGDKKRDPIKVTKLLQSLARNTATLVTMTTLSQDVSGSDGGSISNETVSEYIEVLERLMIVEQLPAWSCHLRSSATLRKSPKRFFVDPAIAVAALGLTPEKLLQDLNYFGLLFESQVMRDLRIYAENIDGAVFHYRDSDNLETDAIIEMPDGNWGAFEVKLGIGAVDEAAKNLLKLKDKINTKKTRLPATLTVITANGFAHHRKDGVSVVPISTLRP